MTTVKVRGIRRNVTLRTVFVVIALIHFNANVAWWLAYGIIWVLSRSYTLVLRTDRPVNISYDQE